MEKLTRNAAKILLTGMLLPLVAWAGKTLIYHDRQIARLDEKEKSNKEILQELKEDVKYIRRQVSRN